MLLVVVVSIITYMEKATPIIVVDEETDRISSKYCRSRSHHYKIVNRIGGDIRRPEIIEHEDVVQNVVVPEIAPIPLPIKFTGDEDAYFWGVISLCEWKPNGVERVDHEKIRGIFAGAEDRIIRKKFIEYYDEMNARIAPYIRTLPGELKDNIIGHFIAMGVDHFRSILETPTLAEFFINVGEIRNNFCKDIPADIMRDIVR